MLPKNEYFGTSKNNATLDHLPSPLIPLAVSKQKSSSQ